MDTVLIINFLIGIYNSLVSVSGDIINFLSKEYVIGLSSYSLYELIFGGGIVILFGYMILKWITDIVL